MSHRLAARTAASLLAFVCVTIGSLAAQTAGVVAVNPSWLKVDSVTRTADFTITAGLNTTNGGINFNGATFGSLRMSVPVGWHVVIHFRNSDATFPHSVEVVKAVMPLPTVQVPPAFAKAATAQLMQGMPTGAHEDMRFTAEKAGEYILFCPVPTHGLLGMWLRFDVSSDLARPAMVAAKQGAAK